MQIANQFRTDILAGKYAQGEYLPSILYLEPECFWKSDCIFLSQRDSFIHWWLLWQILYRF